MRTQIEQLLTVIARGGYQTFEQRADILVLAEQFFAWNGCSSDLLRTSDNRTRTWQRVRRQQRNKSGKIPLSQKKLRQILQLLYMNGWLIQMDHTTCSLNIHTPISSFDTINYPFAILLLSF